MKATGKKRGFFFYENRNTQEFLIIPVNLTQKNKDILENALEWMRKVYKSWEEKEEPKRPFQKRNKICKNCPLYINCWEQRDNGTVDIEVMEVPKI
jgi:CRISPR/Cas system-associated exonuclease Cas4 (RecB family)